MHRNMDCASSAVTVSPRRSRGEAELREGRPHRDPEEVPVPRPDPEELAWVQEALRVPPRLLRAEPAGEVLPEAVRHERGLPDPRAVPDPAELDPRQSEEHTSELQSRLHLFFPLLFLNI